MCFNVGVFIEGWWHARRGVDDVEGHAIAVYWVPFPWCPA